MKLPRWFIGRFRELRRPVFDPDWNLIDRQNAAKDELPGDPYLGAMAREIRVAAERARRLLPDDDYAA